MFGSGAGSSSAGTILETAEPLGPLTPEVLCLPSGPVSTVSCQFGCASPGSNEDEKPAVSAPAVTGRAISPAVTADTSSTRMVRTMHETFIAVLHPRQAR